MYWGGKRVAICSKEDNQSLTSRTPGDRMGAPEEYRDTKSGPVSFFGSDNHFAFGSISWLKRAKSARKLFRGDVVVKGVSPGDESIKV